MSKSKRVFIGLWIGAVLGLPAFMQGSDSRTSAKSHPTLAIARDPATGKIIVNWTGKGVLKQSAELIGHFKPVHNSATAGGALVVDPTQGQQLFRLESASGDIFSVNAVGYVHLALPPGLSLIANPLGWGSGLQIYRRRRVRGQHLRRHSGSLVEPGTADSDRHRILLQQSLR